MLKWLFYFHELTDCYLHISAVGKTIPCHEHQAKQRADCLRSCWLRILLVMYLVSVISFIQLPYDKTFYSLYFIARKPLRSAVSAYIFLHSATLRSQNLRKFLFKKCLKTEKTCFFSQTSDLYALEELLFLSRTVLFFFFIWWNWAQVFWRKEGQDSRII